MTSLSNNRTLRDTVSAVLLVWVLALGAGWAGACLVQPHRADFSRTTDSGDGAGSPARVQNLAAGRGVLVAGHDEAGHASTTSCPGASGHGTQGLVEATSRSDPTDPGPAPLSAPVWTRWSRSCRRPCRRARSQPRRRVRRCASAIRGWRCSALRRLARGVVPSRRRCLSHPARHASQVPAAGTVTTLLPAHVGANTAATLDERPSSFTRSSK